MKKLSIKTAILMPSLFVLIAGISIMAMVAGTLSADTAEKLTAEVIETTIEKHANEFIGLCGGISSAVSAVAPIVEKYTDSGFETNDPRGEVINVLSRTLMTNDDIIAIWTCWEPNAFDGKDSEFADISFYDSTGRFVPYIYKDGTGFKVDALADYDDPVAGEYYLGARNSKKTYITDPYPYQVGNTEIIICSLAVPIIKDGKTAGVVGVDIDLQDFMALMNSASILDSGYLFTLSPGGLLVTHPNQSLKMENYKVTWLDGYSTEVDNVLANGGKLSAKAYSDVIDADISFQGVGVTVGDTNRYWFVCGVIPQKTMSGASNSLRLTIILIGIALIVTVGSIIFYLINHSLKGLPGLTAAAEAIADGDIDFTGEFSSSEGTKNEIALLGRAFSNMAGGIKNQAGILTQISNGDYSVSVKERSEKDVMNRAIERVVSETNRTLKQIDSAASQVYAGSKQVSENSQSLAAGAAKQASAIEQFTATISEIKNKTNETAQIAGEASVLSKTIKEKAEKGSAQMENMMRAVTEIDEASVQIEKVIKVIDDIAFQTNILALNAAVEAARAGQHGKGFAVVAEEVRNLAAKSAQSANGTGNMIEDAKEKAKLGLLIATETAESLKEIIEGINRNADITTRIERATNEQATAISQINEGIEQIAEVIHQNSSASEESASISEEMSEQSEILTRLTAQFKLKD